MAEPDLAQTAAELERLEQRVRDVQRVAWASGLGLVVGVSIGVAVGFRVSRTGRKVACACKAGKQ